MQKKIPLTLTLTKTLQDKNNDSPKARENKMNSKLPPSTKISSVQDNNNDKDARI